MQVINARYVLVLTPNYWYIKCSCSTLLYLKKEINKKLCFLVTRDFIQMINCTEERNQVSHFILLGIIY